MYTPLRIETVRVMMHKFALNEPLSVSGIPREVSRRKELGLAPGTIETAFSELAIRRGGVRHEALNNLLHSGVSSGFRTKFT